MFSFLIRYRLTEKATRPTEISDGVTCDTQQEARRWMMQALNDLEAKRARYPKLRIIEARTYRSAL